MLLSWLKSDPSLPEKREFRFLSDQHLPEIKEENNGGHRYLAEQIKMRSQLVAQFMPLFRLIAPILTFRDKTESYLTVSGSLWLTLALSGSLWLSQAL